jgi:hypothetical protein
MKKCNTCDIELLKGNIAPHAGKDVYFRPDSKETSLAGFFKAAMSNSKMVNAYCCPKCGKIDMYAEL